MAEQQAHVLSRRDADERHEDVEQSDDRAQLEDVQQADAPHADADSERERVHSERERHDQEREQLSFVQSSFQHGLDLPLSDGLFYPAYADKGTEYDWLGLRSRRGGGAGAVA